MSQREVLIVLAHAMNCSECKERLQNEPAKVLTGRALTPDEKKALSELSSADFVTPELLGRAMGVSADAIREYRDHPVARLRHF